MRSVKFTKMHGLGNDFIMINAYTTPVELSADDIRYLGNRYCGVGFDQLLIVEKPTLSEAQFKYRIFNTDGGEVQQCGNGARCFARFVQDEGLTQDNTFAVETLKGIIRPTIKENGSVQVDMGIPLFEPMSLPFLSEQCEITYPNSKPLYSLNLNNDSSVNEMVSFGVVSMGNPHAVISVPSSELAPVQQVGALLEVHPAFPERVNVGFAYFANDHQIHLRVFERGVGETLACGTGACAAAAEGLYRGFLQGEVEVYMKGGMLTVEWAGEGHPLLMTGPATTVFRGECELPS
ncbi:MAG: diaminopimelate epimerase [Pseudomonadota bacterium]